MAEILFRDGNKTITAKLVFQVAVLELVSFNSVR